MISGIDVSSYQPDTNWDAARAAGLDFALIKATESDSYTNPFFARDWAEAKRVGMVRLAYHYCRPDLAQPDAELAYFYSVVGQLEPYDGVAFDFEEGSGNLLNYALAITGGSERRVGFPPLFYSGLWFMAPHGLTGSTQLARCGLWYSSMTATEPQPAPPWTQTAVWQYGQGFVPGVRTKVDLDVFHGTVDQLRLYGMAAQPPQPPQPSGYTNDDFRQTVRLLDTLPEPDIAGAIAYLERFTGGPHAAQQPAQLTRPNGTAAGNPRRTRRNIGPGGGTQ